MNHALLLYGRNPELLYVRKLVLRSAGDEVRTTTDPYAVEQMMQRDSPDVLILCHTLSDAERVRILGLMPSLCPGAKALVLLAGRRSSPEASHANVATLEGPRRLLAVVEQLAAGARPKAVGESHPKVTTVH